MERRAERQRSPERNGAVARREGIFRSPTGGEGIATGEIPETEPRISDKFRTKGVEQKNRTGEAAKTPSEAVLVSSKLSVLFSSQVSLAFLEDYCSHPSKTRVFALVELG